MGNRLALLAIVIAVVSLALHLVGGRSSRLPSQSAPTPDLQPLLARLEELEARLESIQRALDSTSMLRPEREPVEPDPRIDELAQRLAKIEQEKRVARDDPRRELEAARDPLEELRAVLERRETHGALSARTMSLEEITRRALDTTSTEAERLSALGALRGQRLLDGTDARLPVLDEMIELARTSTDAGTRADVWRQLSHVTDRRLLQPLLDALAGDENADAREEAAESLADFLPDADAEAALRWAAQNDTDGGVRRQAAESLAD